MVKENDKKFKVYIPVLEWGSNFNLRGFMKNAPKGWVSHLPEDKANNKKSNDFDIDKVIKDINTKIGNNDNLSIKPEFKSNETTNQHQPEYIKDIDGKRAINIIDFVIEEYGPDIVSDTKLINLLEHFAEDLGHIVEGELVYLNTDIGPVHEKNEKNMKQYITLLESWDDWEIQIKHDINELAKIISDSGLVNPNEINSSENLQPTIANLKNKIINYYIELNRPGEIAQDYIYVDSIGNNDEGVQVQRDEEGKRNVNLFSFEINSISILKKGTEDEMMEFKELWGTEIEEGVLQGWEEGWNEYYQIKATEDSLRNFR